MGTLRSLGLQTRTVAATFMLEAGFVAIQGIVVGALLGAVTGHRTSVVSDGSSKIIPGCTRFTIGIVFNDSTGRGGLGPG